MELSCPADIMARTPDKGVEATVLDKIQGVNFNDLLGSFLIPLQFPFVNEPII